MIRTRTRLTSQEWAQMGSDLKRMRETLFRLWFDSDLQSHLTKVEQNKGFKKVDDGISTLKSQLETAMFKDISSQYKNSHDLLCVFCDSPAGLDPHPEPKKKGVE